MSRDAGTASPLHTASAGLCFGRRYIGEDNNVYAGGAAINGEKQKPARIRGLRRIKKPMARGLHVAGLVSQVARDGSCDGAATLGKGGTPLKRALN